MIIIEELLLVQLCQKFLNCCVLGKIEKNLDTNDQKFDLKRVLIVLCCVHYAKCCELLL